MSMFHVSEENLLKFQNAHIHFFDCLRKIHGSLFNPPRQKITFHLFIQSHDCLIVIIFYFLCLLWFMSGKRKDKWCGVVCNSFIVCSFNYRYRHRDVFHFQSSKFHLQLNQPRKCQFAFLFVIKVFTPFVSCVIFFELFFWKLAMVFVKWNVIHIYFTWIKYNAAVIIHL